MSADTTPHGTTPEAGRRPVPERLTVRLSLQDRQEIERRAEAMGVTPSGYLRTCALSAPQVKARRRKPTADQVELTRLLVALSRIGNNLNQIARALNAGSAYRPDELRESLQALLALKRQMLEVLA